MSIATHHLKLIIILAFLIHGEMVYAETGKAPDPGAVIQGKILYEKYCLICHQKDGVGEEQLPWGVRLPEFTPAMPLNETSHAWHHADEGLAITILEGPRSTKRMPAFKNILSREDVRKTIAYIKSLWSPRIIACQGPKHMRCM